MSSILTNSSALTALQNLNNTQRSLSKTQSQISTGLKVATAADNSTNWSVSTKMKAENSVVGTIRDKLKENSALVKTATSALTQIADTLTKMKAQATQAGDVDGTSGYTEVNKALAGLAKTLTGLIDGASFNGVNVLNSATAGVNIVSGWGGATFTTIDLTSQDLKATLTTGVTAPTAIASKANAETLHAALDAGLTAVRAYAADLGAVQNQIDAQSEFLESLSNSLTNGVSSMVDADMNEASTRLQAQQTQQQLGVQSLSIANQNSQMILKLFQ
ncbi:flagellin N-terminal helical domain-containing protein [Microvirga sp. CF3016]|uniref:flagellin N-terminal helical domain-containing protein n=1 Tax=Microvirga sp. CF3016 TaxID=3110181 RepID=UPI002E7A1203|nr:flagellin [Microvirga sp. CF3016]MEE1612560.1 flagellin [Microvirga sp. CF3016]